MSVIPRVEYELSASTTPGHGSDHGIARRSDPFSGEDRLMPGHPAALPSRVAVTGSQGKLGRAVVGHLRTIGVDVLAIDRAGGDPREVAGEFLLVDLTDHGQVVEALTGGVDEHAAARRGGPSRGHPGPGAAPERGDVREQRPWRPTTCSPPAARPASATSSGRPARRSSACRSTTRRRTSRSTRSTRRGRRAPTRWARRSRRRWPGIHALGPGSVAVGLRFSNVMDVADYAAFPSFDARPVRTHLEPVGLHRRPRRRPRRRARAHLRRAGGGRVHHRQRRHGDDPLQRRPDGAGVSPRPPDQTWVSMRRC